MLKVSIPQTKSQNNSYLHSIVGTQSDFQLNRSSSFIPADTIPLHAIDAARKLKFRETKHELAMLTARLCEYYGWKVNVKLSKLSEMLDEKIGKRIKRTRMKTLSEWLVLAGLFTRERRIKRNGQFGEYGYKISATGLAYYYLHLHRISKCDPGTPLKCDPLLTKNNNKEIKINTPVVEEVRHQSSSPQKVDVDLVKQGIVLRLVASGTWKSTALKWVNQFGCQAMERLIAQAQVYSADNLGGYIRTVISKTPPARIDVSRETKFALVEPLPTEEQKQKVMNEMKKIRLALRGIC